uniref:Eukaryotic translation initiation factor 3 subunit K n=1 Tax=Clastoptera arizonana TaxID=38151 RepID=A0A1B6EA03_9HEMI
MADTVKLTPEAMKQTVEGMLTGIERYNPENLKTLENYVDVQTQENTYDLEANLAVLKLYQFSQTYIDEDKIKVISQILLKALTNFPHTDFVLCKCLLNEHLCSLTPISDIIQLANLLECCQIQAFWDMVKTKPTLVDGIKGFHDSIRKFVCHIVGITYQTIQKSLLAEMLGSVDDQTLRFWVQKYGWKEVANDMIFIANQDDIIKTKNISEKIDFESVASIMARCQ